MSSLTLIEFYQQRLPPMEECKRFHLDAFVTKYFVSDVKMFEHRFTEKMIEGYQAYSTKYLECMWYRFLLSWYQEEKKDCPYLSEDVSLDKDIVETLQKDKDETEEEYLTRYYEMVVDISSLCDELSKELFFYSMKLKNNQENENPDNLGRKIKKVWNKKKSISPRRIDEIIEEFKNFLPPTQECDRLGISSFIKEYQSIFPYLYNFKKEKDVKYIFSALVKVIWLYFLLNWNKTNHSKYSDENLEKLNRKCPYQPKDYGINIEEEILEKTGMLQNETNDEYQERFIDLLNSYRTHYKMFIKKIIDMCEQEED